MSEPKPANPSVPENKVVDEEVTAPFKPKDLGNADLIPALNNTVTGDPTSRKSLEIILNEQIMDLVRGMPKDNLPGVIEYLHEYAKRDSTPGAFKTRVNFYAETLTRSLSSLSPRPPSDMTADDEASHKASLRTAMYEKLSVLGKGIFGDTSKPFIEALVPVIEKEIDAAANQDRPIPQPAPEKPTIAATLPTLTEEVILVRESTEDRIKKIYIPEPSATTVRRIVEAKTIEQLFQIVFPIEKFGPTPIPQEIKAFINKVNNGDYETKEALDEAFDSSFPALTIEANKDNGGVAKTLFNAIKWLAEKRCRELARVEQELEKKIKELREEASISDISKVIDEHFPDSQFRDSDTDKFDAKGNIKVFLTSVPSVIKNYIETQSFSLDETPETLERRRRSCMLSFSSDLEGNEEGERSVPTFIAEIVKPIISRSIALKLSEKAKEYEEKYPHSMEEAETMEKLVEILSKEKKLLQAKVFATTILNTISSTSISKEQRELNISEAIAKLRAEIDTIQGNLLLQIAYKKLLSFAEKNLADIKVSKHFDAIAVSTLPKPSFMGVEINSNNAQSKSEPGADRKTPFWGRLGRLVSGEPIEPTTVKTGIEPILSATGVEEASKEARFDINSVEILASIQRVDSLNDLQSLVSRYTFEAGKKDEVNKESNQPEAAVQILTMIGYIADAKRLGTAEAFATAENGIQICARKMPTGDAFSNVVKTHADMLAKTELTKIKPITISATAKIPEQVTAQHVVSPIEAQSEPVTLAEVIPGVNQGLELKPKIDTPDQSIAVTPTDDMPLVTAEAESSQPQNTQNLIEAIESKTFPFESHEILTAINNSGSLAQISITLTESLLQTNQELLAAPFAKANDLIREIRALLILIDYAFRNDASSFDVTTEGYTASINTCIQNLQDVLRNAPPQAFSDTLLQKTINLTNTAIETYREKVSELKPSPIIEVSPAISEIAEPRSGVLRGWGSKLTKGVTNKVSGIAARLVGKGSPDNRTESKPPTQEIATEQREKLRLGLANVKAGVEKARTQLTETLKNYRDKLGKREEFAESITSLEKRLMQVGNYWNNDIGFAYKVFAATGLMTSGVLAAYAAPALVTTLALGTAAAGVRAASAAATYAALEAYKQKKYDDWSRQGKILASSDKNIHTAGQVAFAALGGAAIGQVLGELLHGDIAKDARAMFNMVLDKVAPIPTSAPATPAAAPSASAAASAPATSAPAPQPITPATSDIIPPPLILPPGFTESLSSIKVEEGNNLWNITKGFIVQVHPEFDTATINSKIVEVLKKIAEKPTLYGISSNNINKLMPGEILDLSEVANLITTK